jgi:hypothetical protein
LNVHRMIDYSRYSERLGNGADHWALLDEFLEAWDQQGPYTWEISEDRISAAEHRLGFDLPLGLKRWYALGSRPLLYWRILQTRLLHPEELEDRQGDAYIPFHIQVAKWCEWAFRVADARLADPPVYIGMELEEGKTDWFFQNATLSEFVLQRVISETILGGDRPALGARYRRCVRETSETLLSTIQQHYHPLGFPKQLWYNHTLLGGPDVILSVSEPFLGSSGGVFVGARSEAGLLRALATLPANWEEPDGWDGSPEPEEVANMSWDGIPSSSEEPLEPWQHMNWPDFFTLHPKRIVPIEEWDGSVFRRKAFWSDYLLRCEEGCDERGYPELDAVALEIRVSDDYALLLDLDMGVSPDRAYGPIHQLCLVAASRPQPVVLGWWDLARAAPYVFRRDELDTICRAVANRNPSLVHPGLIYLLLHRFAPALNDEEARSERQVLTTCFRGLGFSEPEVDQLLGEFGPLDQEWQWEWDDEVGWQLQGDWACCCSMRYEDNALFPFQELHELFKQAVNE